MPRGKARARSFTVYPGQESLAVLGGGGSARGNLAIRMAANLLADAAMRVAEMFSKEEWHLLYECLEGKHVEPEIADPGPIVGSYLRQAQQRFRLGASQAGERKGRVQPLADRVQGLGYLEVWALLLAVSFRQEYARSIGPDDPWWEISYRRMKLDELDAA